MVDECIGVDVILLDLSKAFDSVPYNLLISELSGQGIGGALLEWIEDYLDDRHFRVRVNGVLSDAVEVRSGVRQGDILGPLLFLLYMNDLPTQLDCKVALFADDAKIWGPSTDPGRLQSNLDRLSSRVNDNRMMLNPVKRRVIPIRSQLNNTYNLNWDTIPHSKQEKDLATTICSSSSASPNCQVVVTQAIRALNLLLRSLVRFQRDSFFNTYTGYVRSPLKLIIQA